MDDCKVQLVYDNYKIGNESEDLIEIEDTQCEIDSDEFAPLSKEADLSVKKEAGRKVGIGMKRRFSTFDKEEDNFLVELIKAVYQREPLWNSTLPYEKRGHKVTSALWTEVDQLLSLRSGESQTKFKSLRDRFVRLAGEKKQQKDSEALERPQWKYYEILKFLQPTITYRTSTSTLKRTERSTSPTDNAEPKVSNDISEFMSNAKAYRLEEDYQTYAKKSRNCESGNTSGMSPFEMYCLKQLELLNKPADKISTFCAYLESELRCLSDQKVENVKENILYLILQAKKGHIK